MKRMSVALLCMVAALLPACSASKEEEDAAIQDARNRKFTYLSTDSSGDIVFGYVDVQVSFGEKGCTGIIRYEDGSVEMRIELPIPGNSTETVVRTVDNPQVDTLRSDPAFKHCFEPAVLPSPTR